MTIELCSLRKEKPRHPWDVKVDRSSVLGNPFKSGSRDDQCKAYAAWFPGRAASNRLIANKLERLCELHKEHGKLRLFCWCVPLRCHSETIKKVLEDKINKDI
jgi:hypothetical protein